MHCSVNVFFNASRLYYKQLTGMDRQAKRSEADRRSPVAGPTEGENQRRADIVIAAPFGLTAATGIPAAFFSGPTLNAPSSLAWTFSTTVIVVVHALRWSLHNRGIVFMTACVACTDNAMQIKVAPS
jgi:hypothetical protein